MKSVFSKDFLPPTGGYVDQNFREVQKEFVKNFTDRGEIGGACSVYFEGKKVIDLWGGFKDKNTKEPWLRNSVVQVFSTTKGMTLLVLAKLHSDGLLDYRQKVCKYWPEFAKNGKEDITIEQLVTHKAGLVLLDRKINTSELNDHQILSELLQNARPLWTPGRKHGYHSATIGLFIQQLVRRIDLEGRTIGKYFDEEIAQPLGIDFYIGIPQDFETKRLATLKMINPLAGLFNLNKPPRGLVKRLINPFSLMNRSFALIKGDIDNPIEALKFEEPAGGGVGEARALAKIYGVLAMGGRELNLNPETMEQLIHHTDPPEDGLLDVVMGWKSLGSRAGYAKPDSCFNFGSDQAFGFTGSGGSFAYADPLYQIGYAYVMNKMDFYGMNDPRETALRKAMYQSIWRLEYQRSSMYKTKISRTVKKEEIPL